MSYLVLARKWRPLHFDDVIGQEHITATLKRAIEKNRIAHAYLFTGTRGVGKTTIARILSRAMNCESGPTPDPCGRCDACTAIMQGSSFDVLEIDGASNNSVDDIRELRDNLGYSSMSGKYRIFVIDEVHMLTRAAFNALLKSLEEPPANVIFIFATTEPNRIPDTITSRCQRYDFRRIGSAVITGRLETICARENIGFEPEALSIIAGKADGSMRDALSLLDQVNSFCMDSISVDQTRSVLGLVGNDILCSLVSAIREHNASGVLHALDDILFQGYDLQEFLTSFQEYLRSVLFCRLHLKEQNASLEIGTAAEPAADHARNMEEADLIRMVEIIRAAEQELRNSSFPRFCVEIALLKLVFMDASVSIESILSAFHGRSLEKDTETEKISATQSRHPPEPRKKKDHPAPVAETPSPSKKANPPKNNDTEADKPASFDEIIKQWPAFIDHCIQERPHLGSFLALGYPASAAGQSIDIRFPAMYTFQFSQVIRKENRDDITALLCEFFQRDYTLHLTQEQENATAGRTEYNGGFHSEAALPSFQDECDHEPVIKTVLEILDGEVVP